MWLHLNLLFRSYSKQKSDVVGHGREASDEAGGGTERKTREAQPVASVVAEGQLAVLECPDESAGERLRRGRRLHLHGAVPAAPQSEGLRPRASS